MNQDPARIKRFYKTVSVAPEGAGFVIRLDDRPARTARGDAVLAPTRSLAQAIADEWAVQEEFLDRRVMPLTAILCACLDGGEAGAAVWRDDVLSYLGTDLLCYRAESPQALVDRQEARWGPYLDWLRREFGAAMVVTTGVSAVSQPDVAIAAVRRVLNDRSAEALFALKSATAITGSAVLSLALWKRAFAPDEIFHAARLDERFQEERWGEDAQAKAREQAMRREFLDLSDFLGLLDDV